MDKNILLVADIISKLSELDITAVENPVRFAHTKELGALSQTTRR